MKVMKTGKRKEIDSVSRDQKIIIVKGAKNRVHENHYHES